MVEEINTEQCSIEFSSGTSGGKVGWSVKSYRATTEEARKEAYDSAHRIILDAKALKNLMEAQEKNG